VEGFDLKPALRLALFSFFVWAAIAISASFACAQQIDVAAGGATMSAPSGASAVGNHEPQSLDGGVYPTFAADYLFHKRIGVQGEISWDWEKPIYLPNFVNEPYKPFFYDFNAIYASPVSRHHIGFEILGGVGVQNTRFYQPSCNSSACFGTTNHFMLVGGGGLKYYFWRSFFFRPEGRYYFTLHNEDFSSNHSIRYGATFGYTFRGSSHTSAQ
jgi:hypothetical protein